jgi:hypothetical protein
MIRRLALTVGCIALSAVAFSGKAQAAPVTSVSPQNVDITYTGSVGKSCTTDKMIPGVMGIADNDDTLLTTDPTVSTSVTGVKHGSLEVACNTGVAITIGTVTPTGTTPVAAPAPTASFVGTYDKTAAFQAQVVEVKLVVDDTATLPSGNYSYTVPVTVTPQ